MQHQRLHKFSELRDVNGKGFFTWLSSGEGENQTLTLKLFDGARSWENQSELPAYQGSLDREGSDKRSQ